MHQIRQAVLTDWNTKGPGKMAPLILSDMYDEFLSSIVCDWYVNEQLPKYIKAFGAKDSIEARLISYNAGISYVRPGNVKPLPAITRAYIRMYKELTEKL
jgi:hypothetical protein